MTERTQYVTMGAAKELFAAPVAQVHEILDLRPITRLPQAPANFLGIIDVRGQGVPVLDLRLTLGLEAADDDENTRIVVLRVEGVDGGSTIGLKTDRVIEVSVLDEETLSPAPAISGERSAACIAGIGRRGGNFVTVLDLERLLGDAGQDTLSAAA